MISHKPVTSSDLKHERLFFCGSVSTFLQLVVVFLITLSVSQCICFKSGGWRKLGKMVKMPTEGGQLIKSH